MIFCISQVCQSCYVSREKPEKGEFFEASGFEKIKTQESGFKFTQSHLPRDPSHNSYNSSDLLFTLKSF